MNPQNQSTPDVEDPKDQLEAILERALTAYHRDERHQGADWIEDRVLDAILVPVARDLFLDADELPADHDVLQTFGEPMELLGEGYHVISLVEPKRRFVVKYVKHSQPVPPLAAPPAGMSRQEWQYEHGVRADGTLHPAIWQHIRAFEAYGALAVPSRIYLADSAFDALAPDERRMLDRFRSIGIVRSLGQDLRAIHIRYPDEFPHEKRAPEGLTASVVVVQPLVTPLSTAIEQAVRAGEVARARDLEAQYHDFIQQLWHCGISHLDFSLLNIGITGSGRAERLQIFDPHMGAIDVVGEAQEVRDPLSANPSEGRPVDKVLRSSRDGSRWALWRVQQGVSGSADVPPEGAAAAAALLSEFHTASEGIEEGRGSFGRERFDQKWQQRRTHTINTVMHAELWALVTHSLGQLLRSVLDAASPDGVYDRSIAALGMHDERPLPQFRAALRVYEERPLILTANVSNGASALLKHWGRVQLPAELDVQEDPAIHYHLRDLFTGEMYVRAGDELAQRGLVVGLEPQRVHVLQVQDVRVEDLGVERSLAADRDISEFLPDCTKRVGVVGDVHGELEALQQILRALDFIDAFGHWSARDGTLVFTGDIGHGRHLQEVFDFVHRLAGQAHRVGGRIVWTLGNHDLYVDREGGQGGEDSLGYRLWPSIREAALHPERHPGLTVQAAYFAYGKLFVHGGVLPNIVELAARERGAGDAETVAAYVNDVFRRTLLEHERISARDLPHEIFHIGTSHTRERALPGEIGYEPAGVFTPDLRELDHYRYHANLLPQVVGHTASRRGEIRYAPGSWLARDYIAIDVGRQHGSGNGGLLLTDFGWVAVNPDGPAWLVEVVPLFVELTRNQAGAGMREEHGEFRIRQLLGAYFKEARPKERTVAEAQDGLFADLSPAQRAAFARFFAMIRETGRGLVVTDLAETLTAFSGVNDGRGTLDVIANYLAAGGILVMCSETAFDWFYARFLRPLIVKLGPRSQLFSNLLLILSGGTGLYVFHDGAYQLISNAAGQDTADAFDALVELSSARGIEGMPVLQPAGAAYIGDSTGPRAIDPAIARRVELVLDVGDVIPEPPGRPIIGLRRSYQRIMDTFVNATGALQEHGRTTGPPAPPEVGDTVLWTFERPYFPRGRRLRVRVGGSGFVHAGVTRADGSWGQVYEVPLMPLPEGGYEAVLPENADAFTFFWTEAPWTPRHPGHWECRPGAGRVFTAATSTRHGEGPYGATFTCPR